jgi:hypothetical protein
LAPLPEDQRKPEPVNGSLAPPPYGVDVEGLLEKDSTLSIIRRAMLLKRLQLLLKAHSMNIFGAFTFGSLIKTFLPGFVWLVAIVMLEFDIAQMLGEQPVLWTYSQSKDQAALVLAIPVSILLGLLSNIIVFMGLNDWLVRAPMKRANPDLCALYDDLARRIRDKCWTSLDGADQKLKAAFYERIDPELVLLHSIGVDKLAYVREQYWYHLEFQLNLLLSMGAVALALVLSSSVNGASFHMRVILVVACLIGAALVMGGLLAAARKNYERHIAKLATLMVAVLCPSDEQETSGS